jgi:hypothetical protein
MTPSTKNRKPFSDANPPGTGQDAEREQAYRQGWTSALDGLPPDEVYEALDEAQQAREELKESIWRRHRRGEKIGTPEQLAIDAARGRVHSLAALVEVFDTLPQGLPKDAWERRSQKLLDAWRERTAGWLAGRNRQPDSKDRLEPPSIEACIDSATGFIRAYIDHHQETAHRQQPRFALAGALALVGVLGGRKVADPLDARTNLYCLCIGPPGSGKDHSRRLNSRILAEAGASILAGPDEATSDSAIGRLLEQHPARLMSWDEIGRYLATADALRNPAAYRVVSCLLKLWSSAGDRLWTPTAFADTARTYSVDQPHLCLLGTATPESLYGALGGSSVDDGLLARFNVFVGDSQPRRHKPRPSKLPQELVDFAARWFKLWHGTDQNLHDEHPEPRILPTTSEAEDAFDEFGEHCDAQAARAPSLASLWMRAELRARQFALCVGVSDEADSIDAKAARWGVDLASALTAELCTIAESRLARSPFERDCQEVLRVIQQAPNGIIAKQALCRSLRRLRAKEQADCLQALMEQGRIGTGQDRKGTRYFCADRQPELYRDYLALRQGTKTEQASPTLAPTTLKSLERRAAIDEARRNGGFKQ